jgi:hypothetical protein
VGTIIFGTDALRLNYRCETIGFWGTLEEAVLGNRFWRAQIGFLDKEIASLEELPRQIAEREAEDQRLEMELLKDGRLKKCIGVTRNGDHLRHKSTQIS